MDARDDYSSMSGRVDRTERGISDLTRRLDIHAEQNATILRALDKVEVQIAGNQQLRQEIDRRMEDRVTAVERSLNEAIKRIEEKLSDFMERVEKAQEAQKEFGRRIQIMTMTTALGFVVSIIIFWLNRGFNAPVR